MIVQSAHTGHEKQPNDNSEILDPLTGELISIEETDRLSQLHRRLEEIALELLSTCHQIRTTLHPDSREGGPSIHFDLPSVPFTKKGWVA